MLQRHVNQHFAPDERGDLHKKKMSKQQNSSNFDPYHNLIARKKVEHTNQSESTKNLRRAGVKLKFRKSVFSARNFDFFDAGVMACHLVRKQLEGGFNRTYSPALKLVLRHAGV